MSDAMYERTESRSPLAHLGSKKPYVPHDVIDETTKTAVVGAASGLFVAAIRNAVARNNVGAFSVFTRGAPIIGLCTAAPTAYAFFSRTTMNLREKEDAWGATIGGFACGSIIGLPFRRFAPMMGLGAVMGLAHGTFFLFGNRIDSWKEEDDEFERKEIIRRTKRVPVEQTIHELGEGRGVKGPGYEERRRERIKEKYGFEINPVKATVDGSE